MIHRTWRGVVRAGAAEAYVAHLRTDVFPGLGSIAGYRGARVLRRDVAGGVEFLVVTRWESLAAIRAFAGKDAARAVVAPDARRLMVEFDDTVKHYEEA